MANERGVNLVSVRFSTDMDGIILDGYYNPDGWLLNGFLTDLYVDREGLDKLIEQNNSWIEDADDYRARYNEALDCLEVFDDMAEDDSGSFVWFNHDTTGRDTLCADGVTRHLYDLGHLGWTWSVHTEDDDA